MNYSIKIKFYLLFIVIANSISNNYGQVKMYGGWGTATGYTQQSLKMIHSKNDLSLSGMQSHFGLEFQKKRMSFLGSFSFYPGTTIMRISDIHREGYTGANITRFDLGCAYNILSNQKKIFIKPFLMIGLQNSKKTADLFRQAVRIFGPDYYQTRLPDSEGNNITQIVPSLGVRMGIKISKRVDIGLNIQGVYAFKTYQKIIFYYTYRNDSTERRAVFDSRGSGVFSSIFLSFNISNLVKDLSRKPILKPKKSTKKM
jgi:hypothetical protein